MPFVPAASSKSPRTPPRRSSAPKPTAATDGRLWLVCFQADDAGLPDVPHQTMSFQLVLRAKTPKAALDACRRRLRELRTTTGLFDTPCSIYLDHLIAIEGVGSMPALVNYVTKLPSKSGVVGEVLCAVPEQNDAPVEGFDWEGDDGPFLDFGGQHANALLRRAVGADLPHAVAAPAPRRRGPR